MMTNFPIRLAFLICAVVSGICCAVSLSAQQNALDMYYEAPRNLSAENLRFCQALTVSDHVVLLYEKITKQGETGGELEIVGRISGADGSMSDEFTVVASVPYGGIQAPPLYSAVADDRGQIFVVYSHDALRVTMVAGQGPTSARDHSHNRPKFRELGSITSDITVVAPQLFLKPSGGFVALVTQSTPTSQNSFISRSSDGSKWSPLQNVDGTLRGNINSNPSWVQLGSREYIVFQSLNFTVLGPSGRSYYQLFSSHSDDDGLTWSSPALITSFLNPGDKPETSVASYDNQRPLLVLDSGQLTLFWERSFRSDARQIWRLQLDSEGLAKGAAEQVSQSTSGGFGPSWQSYQGRGYLAWFSSANKGSKAFVSTRNPEGTWTQREMSRGFGASALYPSCAFSQGKMYFFYYTRNEDDPLSTHLVWVEPDQHAAPPLIVGVNFNDGERNKVTDIKVRLLPQEDASGIIGFNLTLSQSPDAPVIPKAVYGLNDTIPSLTVKGDGTWYVIARALDRAGNWSAPAKIRYVLDTTPPDPVNFDRLAIDEKGYLRSNTFNVQWKRPPQADTAGYQYSLQYLGDIGIDQAIAKVISADSLPIMGQQETTSISRNNVENGIYVLVVWSYDTVGNRSKPRVLYLFANKYVPSTEISFIDLKQNILGERYLSVSGKGFTRNGTITRIVLDRDGIAPYDYEFFLDKGDYQVISDSLLEGLKLNNVRSASYLLGVEHSERGFEFSGRRLNFEERGIIKFGDFSLGPQTHYQVSAPAPISIQAGDLILWLVMLLLGIIVVVSVFQLRSVYNESLVLERTARALIEGKTTPIQDELRKVKVMNKQRFGLRVKFTVFFLSLVIGVVLLISLPLSDYTLSRQKSVLAQGLQDRLNVLMESLLSASTIYLQAPDQYGTELAQLTSQGAIMPEVRYITISAQGRDKSDNFDTVWASSDPFISGDKTASAAGDQNKILQRERAPFVVNGNEQNVWFSGRSGIKDSLSPILPSFRADFDTRLRAGLGTLPSDINGYTQQLKGFLLNTTPEGQAEAARVDNILKNLRSQLTSRMKELAGGMLSLPGYNYANYDPRIEDYIFYQPINFTQTGEDPATAHYYRGLVRIGVSTVPINEAIVSTQREIVFRLLLFALLALGGGLVGAIVLSSIIVGPIRKLVRGVEEIREIIGLSADAQERRFGEFMQNGSIQLSTRDELATLGGSIGEMVDGLKHAASANKDLVAGADIQKMFMPLDMVGDVKGTIGGRDTPAMEIFGYYEGAKGVSGDFLNFEQIAPGIWACIKCDVSGKGIPAALIMVEVATIFLSYFEDWRRKEDERKRSKIAAKSGNDGILNPLVMTINDLVNERQFKGRFAAFNIVLYDEKAGSCVFCHAGDKTVFILRDQTRKVETISLKSAPAAGMFSSKDEFPPFFRCQEEKNSLERGDVLLFFTDGIDESRRQYRLPDFTEYLATEDDVARGLVPSEDAGSIRKDVGDPGTRVFEAEQFTWDRANSIAETVRRRGRYQLIKYFNPLTDEVLEFDFSGLEGTARDIVVALAAVEKVFRLIPDPRATAEDRVLVDRVVDEFLQKHFLQYGNYFRNERPGQTHKLYREFTNLKEEDQYDDLAFLAIRRK